MVDTSVVLKWFLPENDSDEAEKLLRAFLSGALNLYAPDLLLVEAASALWRRTVVRAELPAAAFSLALTHRHSAYDAFYCALAAEMDCELITADRSLVFKLAPTLTYIRHVSAMNL